MLVLSSVFYALLILAGAACLFSILIVLLVGFAAAVRTVEDNEL